MALRLFLVAFALGPQLVLCCGCSLIFSYDTKGVSQGDGTVVGGADQLADRPLGEPLPGDAHPMDGPWGPGDAASSDQGPVADQAIQDQLAAQDHHLSHDHHAAADLVTSPDVQSSCVGQPYGTPCPPLPSWIGGHCDGNDSCVECIYLGGQCGATDPKDCCGANTSCEPDGMFETCQVMP